MIWNAPKVEAELRQQGVAFTRHNLLHGRQLLLASGEILNIYPSGEVQLSGEESELATELRQLFARPPVTSGWSR